MDAGRTPIHQLVTPDVIRAKMNDLLRVDPERAAVVTIDMHRGHLDPGVATEGVPAEAAAAVVRSTAALLAMAREREIPVIHVILTYRKNPHPAMERAAHPFKVAIDQARQELVQGARSTLRDHNVEGSVQTQLMPELGPADTDILITNKKTLSAYYCTDLEIALRTLKRDVVVLAGVNTNTCVQCTAFETANRGLTAVVVSDCCTSLYGQDLHRFALDNIARCFGWVVSSSELAEKLGASPAAARG
jgi:biuret amidohydrolase